MDEFMVKNEPTILALTYAWTAGQSWLDSDTDSDARSPNFAAKDQDQIWSLTAKELRKRLGLIHFALEEFL